MSSESAGTLISECVRVVASASKEEACRAIQLAYLVSTMKRHLSNPASSPASSLFRMFSGVAPLSMQPHKHRVWFAVWWADDEHRWYRWAQRKALYCNQKAPELLKQRPLRLNITVIQSCRLLEMCQRCLGHGWKLDGIFCSQLCHIYELVGTSRAAASSLFVFCLACCCLCSSDISKLGQLFLEVVKSCRCNELGFTIVSHLSIIELELEPIILFNSFQSLQGSTREKNTGNHETQTHKTSAKCSQASNDATLRPASFTCAAVGSFDICFKVTLLEDLSSSYFSRCSPVWTHTHCLVSISPVRLL